MNCGSGCVGRGFIRGASTNLGGLNQSEANISLDFLCTAFLSLGEVSVDGHGKV